MEGHAELQGWELLPRVDPLRPFSASTASDDDGGDPFGVITADYFVLDSVGKSGVLQEEGEKKGPSESGDDLKLAEKAPIFDRPAVDEPLEPAELTVVDGGGNGAEEEMDLGGEVCSEGDSDASWLDSWGDEIGCLREFKRAEGDVPPLIGESDRGGDGGRGNGSFGGLAGGGAETKGDAWWKVPLELVKLCLSRVRPVWSVSVAAAVVGLVLLSRRLYRARRLSRRVYLATVLDDKKVCQIPATARLNEAFTVLRQVPSIKAPLPATGVTPWPTMALRL